jgi:hypothetical protein
MKVPHDASPEIQQAFREIWSVLDGLTNRNIDLKGKRITNAGQSMAANDYVTSAELAKVKIALLDLING